MVAFGKESLSGKALYEKLTEKQQNAFVNITDKLASVKLADGSMALSQVGSIFQFQNERFFANVSDVLSTSLQSSNDFAKVPAGMHAPFNDVSFKDTGVLFGNIQFSLNRARTGSDIDIDIANYANGLLGMILHGGEVLENKLFNTETNQDTVRRILLRDPKIQTITPSRDPRFNRQ